MFPPALRHPFPHLLVTEHAVLGGLTLPPGAGGHLIWLIRPFDLATVIASGAKIQTEPALGRSCCQDTLSLEGEGGCDKPGAVNQQLPENVGITEEGDAKRWREPN